MTYRLTKAEAVAFQGYLIERFGVLGEHFGIMDHHWPDLNVAEDTVDLPEHSLAFLVPSWRFSQQQ